MLTPNTKLKNGRYCIVRQIGEGGFGVVYEAQDLRQKNKKVALKEAQVNNPEFRPDLSPKLRDTLRHIFETEAKRLMKLHHPALPIAIDFFKEGNRQYFVMEYIEGANLEEQLQRKGQPFSVKEVLEWADQLLDVLVYLHAQKPPLIHRDIKPQNLILRPDEQIMLLDFGIAKGGLTEYSSKTDLPGSYSKYYSPPEQIDGGTDQRSDLYALGATLYQLLTNKRAVPAQYRQQANNDRLSFDNLVKNNPHVPAGIMRVLADAMALDPDKRPPNAKEMREMLRRAPTSLETPDSKKFTPVPLVEPKESEAPTSPNEQKSTVPIKTPLPARPIPPTGPSTEPSDGTPFSDRPPVWQRWVAPVAVLLLLIVVAVWIGIFRPKGCVELDVKTFTVDGNVINTGEIYTVTLINQAKAELLIQVDVVAQPSDCQPELDLTWTASDSDRDEPLEQFQNFHQISRGAPPVGKSETIQVSVEDMRTGKEASTFFILKSVSEEESKGEP